MIYAGVICSAVNYNLCSFATKHLDATIVQSYSVLNPVIAMGFNFFYSGTPIAPTDYIGVALVLVGLPLVGQANQTGTTLDAKCKDRDEAAMFLDLEHPVRFYDPQLIIN